MTTTRGGQLSDLLSTNDIYLRTTGTYTFVITTVEV